MATAFAIESSQVFEGNDGPWSTFRLSAGTPQRHVNVLPSNTFNYIVATDASLCQNLNDEDYQICMNLRGGVYSGNTSGTFVAEGTFNLSFPHEKALYPLQCTLGACNNTGEGYFASAASLYGTDIVSLADSNGKTILLDGQLIASYAGAEPDIGFLGLGTQPYSFNSTSPLYPSPLQSLWDSGLTTSRYWAYHAGSSRSGIDGSLTIGGYDRNRGDVASSPYWSFKADEKLVVEVNSISINTGFIEPFAAAIDITVPELWLPGDVCDIFESTFGLTWDEDQYMYILSEQQRQSLKDQDRSVSFTLGGTYFSGTDSGHTTVKMSYASSFDLEVKWPLGGIETLDQKYYYFPLKRAQNAAQYTLGRAFFQETYLAVDYDRERFCIAPSKNSDVVDIVTVDHRNHTVLSNGVIAGIAVGGAAILLAIVALVLFCLKKRRRARSMPQSEISDGRMSSPLPSQMSPQMSQPQSPPEYFGYYESYGKQEMDAASVRAKLSAPRQAGAAELFGGDFPPRDHRRTLSGDTLQMSPMSQSSPGMHGRTISHGSSELEATPYRSPQQRSPVFGAPSPPEELEAPSPMYELPQTRLTAPFNVHDLPSQRGVRSP